MENFVNKVAIVTGSSSGIGAGISKELAQKGCIVVGLARRKEKLQVISSHYIELYVHIMLYLQVSCL